MYWSTSEPLLWPIQVQANEARNVGVSSQSLSQNMPGNVQFHNYLQSYENQVETDFIGKEKDL